MISNYDTGCPDCGETLTLKVERAPDIFYLELSRKDCSCPETQGFLEKAYARLCEDGEEVPHDR